MAQILYFGRLADEVGCAAETVQLADGFTVGELRARHPALAGATVKAAVNRVLADDSAALSEDDELAFLPPVSGG